MQTNAANLDTKYVAAIKKKGVVEQKTSQSEVKEMFDESTHHVLNCTGNVIVIPKYDAATRKQSTTEFDVYLQTTRGVKVPLNVNHADQVKSVTKESKVSLKIAFNELKAPAKREGEKPADFTARETLYKTLSSAASIQEFNGKKGYFVMQDVTIEL